MIGWAVLVALGSAACYALGSAVQQLEAARITDAVAGAGLLWHLTRRPGWIVGMAAMVAGAGLHILALSWGPLPLIQPLGVASLLFALPMGAALNRRPIPAWHRLGAGMVAGGLAALLAILRPGTDRPVLSAPGTAVLVGTTVAGLICCVAVARRTARYRPVALATGAGICFGATSALVRVVGNQVLGSGAGALFNWPTIAMVVLAPAGFVVVQHAYRAGDLSVVLSTTTVVDPLIAVGFAVLLLGDTVHAGPIGTVVVVLAAFAIVVGVAVLTRPVRLPVADRDRPPASTSVAAGATRRAAR
jgi:hypothetical protein